MKTLYDFGYKLGSSDIYKELPIKELMLSIERENKNDILELVIRSCSILKINCPDFILKELSSEENLIIYSQKIIIGILDAYNKDKDDICNLINSRKLLSIKEASKLFKKAPETLRRHIELGNFKKGVDCFQIDSKWIIKNEALVRKYGIPTDKIDSSESN